jgi:hypothetical protein
VDVGGTNTLDQLNGGKDLVDAFLAKIFKAELDDMAEGAIGGNDGAVSGEDRQGHGQAGHHFLVVAALGLDQREEASYFPRLPLLKSGPFHDSVHDA